MKQKIILFIIKNVTISHRCEDAEKKVNLFEFFAFNSVSFASFGANYSLFSHLTSVIELIFKPLNI